MIGALWTGISGLSSQQKALDNESNNIANVNTVGYKASRISFADQMYQDRIGKGSKVLDAEKLYTQGNMKLTGVNYDMALSGDGFFTVKNSRQGGGGENFYTRAGNFRMGDNGTLQDAAKNEVQGWAMKTLDPDVDVLSTNPNTLKFTDDYSKLLGTRIVRHDNYIETITAKATNYEETAKADSADVFSGTGLKTKAAKLSDIEELKKDYIQKLQDLKNNPDGASATSIAQVSQIDFKGTTFNKEGDQISITINGTTISQKFVKTTASAAEIANFESNAGAITNNNTSVVTNTVTAANDTRYRMTINGNDIFYDSDSTATLAEITTGLKASADALGIAGLTVTANAGPGTVVMDFGAPTTGAVSESSHLTSIGSFDLAVSRIATYKALADQISSKVPGVVAYNVIDSGGVTVGQFEDTDTFSKTTNQSEVLEGMIEIKSMVPGKDFVINTVQEQSSGTTINGEINDTLSMSKAKPGTGVGAVQTAREALSRAVVGSQRNVYTTSDIDFGETNSFTFSIYDKESKKNYDLPVGDIPALGADVSAAATTLNSNANFSKYLIAENVNGHLVIKTNDANFDVEFSTTIAQTSGAAADQGVKDKNADYSGRVGAGAEFLQITNTIEQTQTQNSLQLKLDSLNISDSAFGEFSVDSTGLITMKQDGVDFAIGQVSIALFNNQRGLLPSGDNLLAKTTESGDAIYNVNNNKTAKVEGKTLELSTADLSESLVNLMVFQRAFEANAKSITTSDQLLNTLINLKR